MLAEADDRVAVYADRVERILGAQRRADQRRQRENDVSLGRQPAQQCFVTGVAANRREVLESAARREHRVAFAKQVKHRHVIPRLQQSRDHDGAEISRAARNQHPFLH